MNMKKYMTFKVEWQKYIGMDEETMTSIYSNPEIVDVFIYGKNIYIQESDKQAVVSAKVYLTLADVKVKDILDKQVVKSVSSYPESWDSRVQLFECLTWNT